MKSPQQKPSFQLLLFCIEQQFGWKRIEFKALFYIDEEIG